MTTNAAIQERIANLGAIGTAPEATFGTPVAATNFSDAMSTSLKPDPALFFPPQMIGVRDSQVFSLHGAGKLEGAVEGMLVPTNGIEFLNYGIGGDSGSNTTTGAKAGITGTPVGGGWSTTPTGNIAANATTFTVTSAAGMATGDFMQFGTAGTPANNIPEVRKITVSGTTITLDSAVQFAHTSSCTLTKVQAPFTHTLIQQNYLNSLTIEKNIGNFQSEQYAGCKVSKFSVKIPNSDAPATFSADIMAKAWTTLSTPTSIVVPDGDVPFVFSEAALTLNTTTIYETYNLNLSVDNLMAGTHTNAQYPTFLTAQGLKVNGSFDAVFGSLTDATIGFLTQVMNGTVTAPLTIALTHPTVAYAVSFVLDNVEFKTDDVQIKPDTLVTETINFEAYFSTTNLETYHIVVASPQWLPF